MCDAVSVRMSACRLLLLTTFVCVRVGGVLVGVVVVELLLIESAAAFQQLLGRPGVVAGRVL